MHARVARLVVTALACLVVLPRPLPAGDDCLWIVPAGGPACSGCTTTISCECLLGTCTGTHVYCQIAAQIEQSPFGFNSVYLQQRPCYSEYGCRPQDPGSPCGENNACVPDYFHHIQDSSQKKWYPVGSGSCGEIHS